MEGHILKLVCKCDLRGDLEIKAVYLHQELRSWIKEEARRGKVSPDRLPDNA